MPQESDKNLLMTLCFSGTVFLGSFLLFFIQPLIGNIISPLFGGGAVIWLTLLMFFQAMLLFGYIYVDRIFSLSPNVQNQKKLHIGILILALFSLTAALPVYEKSLADGFPVLDVTLMAILFIGPAYFALATTAPLIQKYFNWSDHKNAAQPYPLYATSNLGAVLALLSYPFIAEPLFDIPTQKMLWNIGFILYSGLFTGCLFLTWKQNPPRPEKTTAQIEPPDIRQRLQWVLWAFVPSSLLLGVTSFLTTSLVGAVPLLWVVPLFLYLVTFILAFSEKYQPALMPVLKSRWFFLAGMGYIGFFFSPPMAITFTLHLAVFFTLALSCHIKLSHTKPDPAYLSRFYIYLALGGFLGGVFNSILAPLIFPDIAEYPLMIAAALLIVPTGLKSFALPRGEKYLYLILALATLVVLGVFPPKELFGSFIITLIFPAGFYFALRLGADKRIFGALLVLICLTPSYIKPYMDNDLLGVYRSFYNIYHVVKVKNRQIIALTQSYGPIQGAQHTTADKKTKISFYFPDPHMFIKPGEPELVPGGGPIGIIGLGAGSMACVAQKEQEIHFFEIDPIVQSIAENNDYFTYLRDCPGIKTTIIGDGRIELSRKPDHSYSIIVLDAFSTFAPPAHLITVEAFETYLSKLQENGIILMNVTSKYLSLTPLLRSVAQELGLHIYISRKKEKGAASHHHQWVAIAKNDDALEYFAQSKWWRKSTDPAPMNPWRDHHKSFLSLLRGQ